MAERKAVNKYYPPEWTPDKGSLNTFHGQHALRERARKLDQGIMVIRFEMPYNIWCNGCKNHIGKGVRYNAEKKSVGKYFSSKIWRFRMKCHLCPNYIEIETDPANRDYKIVAGAERKMEEWTPEEDDSVIVHDEEESKRLAEDPFYRLEHANVDIKKAKDTAPVIQELQKLRSTRENDYELSSVLRKNFRTTKKEIEGRKKEAEAIGHKGSILLPHEESDKVAASQVRFKYTNAKLLTDVNTLKHKVGLDSIFEKKNNALSPKDSSPQTPTKQDKMKELAKIRFLANNSKAQLSKKRQLDSMSSLDSKKSRTTSYNSAYKM